MKYWIVRAGGSPDRHSWRLRFLAAMGEHAALCQVEDGGKVIILEDGRRLLVAPHDTSAVCSWSPMAGLTFSKNNNIFFNITVQNEQTCETIAARKTSRPWR
jgi:hypothetical protein